MNDPFKEIADRAHFNIYHSDLWYGTARRFAEMIVKDCADTIQDFVDHRFPASEYPERLKKYFDIEQ